ncbi:uncharacterized protein LOC142986791 isoform X2 [Anticarsia gemmatalis]|uniref:uncharacterized protein LOC142986791 isoform X2 n=1 Tax=Anticarsia gemmatalis TaxID=129554 RepID=UPI003F7648A5
MKVPITFTFLFVLVHSSNNDLDKTDNETSRKHYGLSFHVKCSDYVKTFTCMTACKSIGYQVFRMDFRCKCSCHDLKTTTILPFFKWRTNGTTRKRPETYSVPLYHIVGTLSPATEEEEETTETTAATNQCNNYKPDNDTATSGTGATGDTTTENSTGGAADPATTTVSD